MSTLREAYEIFLDRGSPICKGERRRPVGGMNAAGWRKMCRDIRLWKDLAKASIIFEEVTRGQRAMDFELFQTALAIAAERKNVTLSDMAGFVQHYASILSGGGDDSSVTSMGSGGSLNSMESMGSLGSMSSIGRMKKGGKIRRRKNKGKRPSREPQSSTTSGEDSAESKIGLAGMINRQPIYAPVHGIATTSILEESKDWDESKGDGREAPYSPDALVYDSKAQTKYPSLKSFAKVNDAKGEYEKHIALTLETLNTSLLNREELSDGELEASGFSWEVKERLNTKIMEGKLL